MATSARYCPFCGARLRYDDDPLADHLRDRQECRESFEAWDVAGTTGGDVAGAIGGDPAGTTGAGAFEDERARQMRTFLKWVIIAVVVLYAFLIAMDPLLGVLAAGIVYLAFRFTGRT